MATLSFDRVNKIVTVVSPDIELSIQELYDKVRDYEDEPGNLDLKNMISAGGKEDLGGGVSVGVTATLLDGWQVFFQLTSQDTRISGGNLVALDAGGSNQSPISNANIVKLEAGSGTTAILSGSGVTPQDVEDISTAVWEQQIDNGYATGTFGDFVVTKLLTVSKWIGLRN